MKLSLLKASGIAVLAVGFFSGSAFAAIGGTKHDLSAGSGSTYTPGAGQAELCVFCHTPHAADISGATNPPLWNRALGGLPAFTMYTTSTIDGWTAADPSGSISIACLSCHDGSTAINSVINAPGSGLATGWEVGGAWTAGFGVNAATGKMNGASTALGSDLRNDHPISIQYAGGPNADLAGGDFTVAKMKDNGFNVAKYAAIGATPAWHIDQGAANGLREKTDILLYTRLASGSGYVGAGGNAEPFVECASCHDPHGTTNPTFLRATNLNSGLCLGCHNK